MKILLVTECLGGGVLTYIANVANHFVNSGHEVVLVYSSRKQTPANEILKKMFNEQITLIEVAFKRSHLGSYLNLYRAYKQLIEVHQPDIIHFHSSIAGLVGRTVIRFNRIKINSYYTPHGYSFLQITMKRPLRAVFLFFEMVLAGLCKETKIIPISDSEYNVAREVSQKAEIIKVLTGIDTQQIDNKIGEAHVKNKGNYVISSGRLSEQKNPLLFVEVAKLCKERELPCKFIWIGGGELLDVVSKKIGDYKLDNIEVTGWLEYENAIKKMYQYGNIYIQTSLWEGLPLTILEAMYMEACVIVNLAPGNFDPIIQHTNGYVASNANDFADKIELLTYDEKRKKEMAANARQFIIDNYDIKKNADLLLRRYKIDSDKEYRSEFFRDIMLEMSEGELS